MGKKGKKPTRNVIKISKKGIEGKGKIGVIVAAITAIIIVALFLYFGAPII